MQHIVRTILPILALAATSLGAWGQSLYAIDSLTKKLESAVGTPRIDILLLLSQEHWQLDTLKANEYARQAYQASKEIHYPKGLVWGIAYQGVPHEYFGKYDVALQFYQEGLQLAYAHNFKAGVAESLGNIGIAYQGMHQNDSASKYYHASVAILREIGDQMMLAEQLMNIGIMHIESDRYDSALVYMKSAREVAASQGDSITVASCYQSLGSIEAKLGRTGNAYHYLFAAMRIYEQQRIDGGMARIYDFLGSLYGDQGKYQESVEAYEKAYQIRKKIGDQVSLPVSLNNVGQAYLSLKQYDKAMDFLTQGFELSQQMNRTSLAATFMHNIGFAHSRQGKYAEALEEYAKSLAISQRIGDKSSEANTYMTMGGALWALAGPDSAFSQTLFDSALRQYERGLAVAEEIGSKQLIRVASSRLGTGYMRLKRFEEAAKMFRMEVAMTDSLFDEQQHKVGAELNAKYQMRQNAEEMEQLRKEQELNAKRLEQQRMLFFALGAILLLTLAFIAVLYHNNQRTKRMNAELARQQVEIQQRNEEILIQQESIERQNHVLAARNEELKELDNEKNYLINVVAHDLKSPISQVKGLLAIVQFDADRLSDNAKKMLDMADHILENTSEMIAKILDLKAIESKTLNLKLEVYDVRAQLQELVDSFQGVANQKSIELVFDAGPDPLPWDLDKGLVEQIMENLISNAIKFSPNRKTVTVGLKREGRALQMRVADQGPGIHPEEMGKLFQKYQRLSAKPTGGESSTGLGLSIVKRYVEAMNGRVWCESDWGRGAAFIIQYEAKES
jgi:signal transduction histidine kinase